MSWRSYFSYLYYNILNSPHIYVFRHADYEYNSKNGYRTDFYGENHESPMNLMVFGVYLKKYWKFWKMFQTNIIAIIKIYILCCKNFLIALIAFEKFDEKLYDMKHYRVLDVFFKHDGENLMLLLLLPLLQYLEFSPYLRITVNPR